MPKETYQKEELNRLTSDEKDTLILGMQDEILSLKKNYEQLMEQFRVFEQQRFGRHTEKLDQIRSQDRCAFSMKRKSLPILLFRSLWQKRSFRQKRKGRSSQAAGQRI